jgi:hypothetical protein
MTIFFIPLNFQNIPVNIHFEVNHEGWHEFRLCPYSNTGVEDEACFNSNLLKFTDGTTRHLTSNGNSDLILPAGLTCERCVLQWHWYGEGSNQYYRNCADISIH